MKNRRLLPLLAVCTLFVSCSVLTELEIKVFYNENSTVNVPYHDRVFKRNVEMIRTYTFPKNKKSKIGFTTEKKDNRCPAYR